MANVVLALSVGVFVSSLLFFLMNTLNNPTGFFGSASEEGSSIEEYLYYDITSDSASLYINLEMPISQATVSCKPESGQAKKFESKTLELTLNGLMSDMSYSCSATLSGDNINISQSIGAFTTKSENYLDIGSVKADAYDVSFNVVFRASWESEASNFLITKSSLGESSNIISQHEEILSTNTYLDNKLEIGKRYQYEIRAISGSTVGNPAIFNFTVAANQRLEDISPEGEASSLRILDSNFQFNNEFSPKVSIASFSDIETANYNSYVSLSESIPFLVDSPLGLDGLILAGTLSKNNIFKPTTLYETPEKKELQIQSVELIGKDLKIRFNYTAKEVSYYTPNGVLNKSKIDTNTNTAVLDYEHSYINILVENRFVKINQSSPNNRISYDPESGIVSWSAAAHYKGFLVLISTPEGDEVYRVGTSSTNYAIDVLPNLDKVNVEILGYPDFGTPKFLGSQLIKLPESNQSITIKTLVIEKAGSSLALKWDGDLRNQHYIQISPRNRNAWQTVATIQAGSDSHILPEITKLNTGNYNIRLVPERQDVVGNPYNYECYLKVDKNINYQIICE